MKYLVSTSVVVLLSVSFSPDMLIAQAENVFKRTYEGEVVQASYITFDDFEKASLSRGRLKSDEVSSSATIQGVTLSDLLSAASLDQVTQYLGNPESLEKKNLVREGSFIAYFHYEGLKLEYIKAEKKGKILLRDLTITGSEWSLTVNGSRVHIGMPESELSTPVRESVRTSAEKSTDGGRAVIHLRNAKTTDTAKAERSQSERRLGISIDVDGRVKEITFHRMI